MKMNINLIWSLLLAVLVLQGCKEDEPDIGEPFGKAEGLTATSWVLQEAYLVDEGNPSKPEKEVTANLVTSDDSPEINFNADGSFESSVGGGIALFPASGEWSFNNPETPSSIVLTSSSTVITSPLGGPTRIVDNELRINVQRFCNVGGEEKAVLGYRLVYVRKS